MTGIVTINPDSGSDLAALINTALADPTVTTVILGAGEFLLHSSIIVPSGKTLIGAGRDQTVLRAAQDFQIIDSAHNSVVISEPNATGITLSDFAVDAAKLSPSGLRLNGVFMKFATDFEISRVDVSNATGYAHFAQGDLNGYFGGRDYVQASGSYTDCQTFNSQVHFEQMFANGVTLTNCHARDGDGDISTEAYFHPLVGSTNITYIDSSAVGGGFLGFSVLSSSLPVSNLTIINTTVEITSPSTGSALIALGNLPVDGLTIVDSSFIAHNYIAVRLGGVTGTASGSYFQGGLMGVQVTTSGNGTPSSFVVTDSDALGLRDPASTVGVAGVHSDFASYLTWYGGTIEARARVMFPISGAVTLSPETALIRSGFDAITTFFEDAGPLAAFAGEAWTLPTDASLNGAELRVDFLAFGWGEDELSLLTSAGISVTAGEVNVDGRVVGTLCGGAGGSDLVITLNAAATHADAQALLAAIGYRNTADEPSYGMARLVLATLTLADGTQDAISGSVAIRRIDDATEVDLGAAAALGVIHTEGATATILASEAVLADSDSTDLVGSILTVRIAEGYQTGDRLQIVNSPDAPAGLVLAGQSVFYDRVAFAVVTTDSINGVLRISLTAHATLAAVEALVRAIGFNHSGDAPDTDPRAITFDLRNGQGLAVTLDPVLLNVTAVDDAATAVADLLTTTEAATVTFDPLANDSDPDQLTDTVVAVAGQPIAPGETVILANGARVTMLANGQLQYDPAAAFAWLAAPGSGTTLTQAEDSFTYTLSGGGMATVTVTVSGVSSAEDILQGDSAANQLLVSLAGQTLAGLGGADQLDDGALGGTLIGGTGDDTYRIGSANSVIVEAAGEGTDSVHSALSRFTLGDNLENLTYTGPGARFYGYGNALNNVIEGGEAADFLFGYAGNDTLRGGGGADVLDGGAGHDVLDGGAGGDVMIGGAGNDIYRVDSINDYVIDVLNGGADTVYTSLSSYVAPGHIENLSFSGTGDFTGTGNELNNQMLGSNWVDTLSGLDGDDRLAGFAGNDVLDGGAGDDWLFGGYGADQLTGGDGADYFRFDTPLVAGNVDTITDFASGIDRFELSATVFAGIAPGLLDAGAFVIGTAAATAASRIIYDPLTGTIWYDADGDGAAQAVQFATVDPGTVIQHGDFFIS